MYVYPSYPLLSNFYSNREQLSIQFLKRGINFWKNNKIYQKVVLPLNLVEKELYQLDCSNDEFNALPNEKFESIKNTEDFFEKSTSLIDYSTIEFDTILLAISVESFLKGNLLKNGFIIHTRKRVEENPVEINSISDFSQFKNKTFSLGILARPNFLKGIFPEKNQHDIAIINRNLTHLNNLRNLFVHSGATFSSRIYQRYDLLMYKTCADIFAE